ncbi:AraC family transcriptional regulator [Alloalcanivorax xenomutans]|uniref:AraC family transcriptional regulator n=1 Tax=Alloalcanivorax xenomutans TaxID=1094342 RepID=UPI0004AE11BB
MDKIAFMIGELSPQVETSQWPLPKAGRRVVIPHTLVAELAEHPLCRDCMPHGVGFYPAAAGHHMGRAAPRDHLVIYCLAGSGVAELEGRRQPVRAGDVLLLREGQRHRYRANPQDPWTIYWVHLGGAEVDTYFDEILSSPDGFTATVGQHSRLTEDLELLLTTVTRFRPHHLIYAANLLKSLLSFMALMRRQRQARNVALDVPRIQAWLQAHLHQRIELEQLVSATSELSLYHFIREYKRQTGQTPMQAFQHLKITRACYLLDITDLSITQVAADLGYDDPYYFSRQFKKVMGVAPRDYRRERSER